MASGTLANGTLRLSVLGLATAGLLMGCVEGGGSGSATQGQSSSPAVFRAGGEREVEAPEVFQVTDSGLWDGRPSLGGIWVASPDVTDPERVVIVNPATGQSVNGALFRRERDNPGPPLQVSSDAAEALGMLAGQPTTIRVTALRKRGEPAPAPEAEPTAVAAAAPDGAAAGTATDSAAAETAALATAALAATGAAADGATDAAAVTADGAVDAAATEAPKPKTWKERRAEAKAKREAEKAAKAAAAAEAEAAAAAAAAGTTAVAGEATGEPAATAENAAVATVETAPLDARTPEVSAAADAAATTAGEAPAEPKKTRRQIRAEKKAAEEAAAAAAAAAAAEAQAAEAPAADPQAPAAAAGRTIQIASYSKESNATRAVETLAKIGITGQITKTEKDGKTVWGVITTGDDAQLTAIKGAGFADAFYLQ